MASTWQFFHNGYQFAMTFGTGDGDGVIILPGADMDDPEWFKALKAAYSAYPHVEKMALVGELLYDAYYQRDKDVESFRIQRYREGLKLFAEIENKTPFDPPTGVMENIQAAREILARVKNRKAQPAKKEQVRTTPGYVYLIRSSTGFFKIGHTKNPENRMATFNVKLPFEVEFVCLISTEDMIVLEKTLHRQFANKRVNGEWFDLTTEDVEYIKGLTEQAAGE